MPVQDLAKFGLNHTVGQRVKARCMGNDCFSLLPSNPVFSDKKGSLLVARYIKYIPGKGVTVQLPQNKYGFLPICEITDDLDANVAKLVSEKHIFATRIIDFESKTGKAIVSARQSVITSWSTIQGSSIEFKEFDQKRWSEGNLRNKILKYGGDVAL